MMRRRQLFNRTSRLLGLADSKKCKARRFQLLYRAGYGTILKPGRHGALALKWRVYRFGDPTSKVYRHFPICPM